MAASETLSGRVLTAFGGNSVAEVNAGFTNASKFVASKGERQFFLKVADEATHDVDAKLIEYESDMYGLLQRLGLTGSVFPEYYGLVDKSGLKILTLEYLAGFSWGKPWTHQSVDRMDKILQQLHDSSLDDSTVSDVSNIYSSVLAVQKQSPRLPAKTAKEQRERDQPVIDLWDPSVHGFKKGDGQVYFKGRPTLMEELLAEAQLSKPPSTNHLVLHDMNAFNIGVFAERVCLVDTVFARIGDPSWDRTMAGVHILNQLDDSSLPGLRQEIEARFLTDRPMLARVAKLYVHGSGAPADSMRPELLNMNLGCAKVALDLFNRR